MNTATFLSRLSVMLLAGLVFIGRSQAATATLYTTGFEPSEGFNLSYYLSGQGGWTNAGNGGNGLISNSISGYGQQAYVGYFAPSSGSSLSVWKPINFAPSNATLVRFSTVMSLIDSTTTNRDEFYWSIYNRAGQRLCGLLFDNRDLSIWREADDGYVYDTGWGFVNGAGTNGFYTLEIALNFSSNRWSAFFGGTQIISNALITTTNSALNLGDVDAEWVLAVPTKPGNNFLVFDNYTITADAVPQVIPSVQPPTPLTGGQHSVRVTGRAGVSYALEASTNLTSWSALKTNVATGGFFDFTDAASTNAPRKFYRARWIP
ncbi:MAG: hypothetical protein RLY20_174 [Verrucomicrobiota bacterium]|jgi:hypothetical protein